MKALHLISNGILEYLLLACKALKHEVLKKVSRSSHGTCKLSFEDIENPLIPLPPLAEQKRIVAKVDSLLSLCDALAAKLKAARDSSATLMEVAARKILVA